MTFVDSKSIVYKYDTALSTAINRALATRVHCDFALVFIGCIASAVSCYGEASARGVLTRSHFIFVSVCVCSMSTVKICSFEVQKRVFCGRPSNTKNFSAAANGGSCHVFSVYLESVGFSE